MEPITLRPAVPEDAGALLEIYRPYVENTAITFEYDVPTLADFTQRVTRTLEKFPYLVAQRGDEILGYAYAGPFHPRVAYQWAVEVTIYLRQDQRGNGLGRRLYDALEDLLRAQNVLLCYACIAYPEQEDEYLTQASVRFHGKLGYAQVGRFRQCGYKFGRWYDMVWMEKRLGQAATPPPAFIPFPKLQNGGTSQ